MYLIFILSLTGCVKKNMIKAARNAFTNENCVKTLETYMRSAVCPEVLLDKRPNEIVIRCKKPDSERQSIWDRYWFRISPAILKISDDQKTEVERHTICIDKGHRVEAYPPQ